ncbi:MAG: DegV family protein [Bacilli bacterium]|jgi:DegV family protein with EDD domain|nr:DegV family protein [Bacilli bacterium]MDD2681822.1 DegV family protein [Bacilli bacterium]MDD3121388.1 DegV family protein [Bacilli bacterium]MDD4063247.1 DegV family protein [Bacilli bacterium]MDD4482581.1 DegV family protein [Bacilli bacterium]
MNKIKIITDSTTDLSKELYDKYDIEVLPLFVTIGEETYKDFYEIDAKKLYDLVEKHKTFPKTAAITPLVLEQTFQKYIDQGYDILFTSIGSGFSMTFNNAKIAASLVEKDRVFLVDSQNLSSGTSLLIFKMIKYIKQGLSAKEVSEMVQDFSKNVRSQFAINSFDYLHKGGRCSGTAKFVGTALRLKPIIKVVDGGMMVGKKPIGFKKALNTMLEDTKKDLERIDKDVVFVTHSLNYEDAEYLKECLINMGLKNIITTCAGAVISTHCGEKTIGILYLVKE